VTHPLPRSLPGRSLFGFPFSIASSAHALARSGFGMNAPASRFPDPPPRADGSGTGNDHQARGIGASPARNPVPGKCIDAPAHPIEDPAGAIENSALPAAAT
jgi:hypothetical protein